MVGRSELIMQGNLLVDPEEDTLGAGEEAVVILEVVETEATVAAMTTEVEATAVPGTTAEVREAIMTATLQEDLTETTMTTELTPSKNPS